MKIFQRTNAMQKCRDDLRAKLYYFDDAWAYVYRTFDRIDDRIHPGTWRRFTPLIQDRILPTQRTFAVPVQRRAWGSPFVPAETRLRSPDVVRRPHLSDS